MILTRLSSVSKKLVTVSVIALVIGIVSTVGVLAAIPNTTTGAISACRNNFTGGLRAIDAQTGSVCNGLETPLKWNSDDYHSALVRIDKSIVDGEQHVSYNASRSRNVAGAIIKSDPNPENAALGHKYICLKFNFSPEIFIDQSDPGTGGSHVLSTTLRSYPNGPDEVNYACGPSYHAAISFVESHTAIGSTSFFFSN